MEAFPFTTDEWTPVRDTLLSLVNAGMAEDTVLEESHFAELLGLLAALREQHGDHPALLETEADFTNDNGERIELYQRSATIAMGHGLPTLTIRLSLADALLELGRPIDAAGELSACEPELPGADESDRAWWSELATKVRNAEKP